MTKIENVFLSPDEAVFVRAKLKTRRSTALSFRNPFGSKRLAIAFAFAMVVVGVWSRVHQRFVWNESILVALSAMCWMVAFLCLYRRRSWMSIVFGLMSIVPGVLILICVCLPNTRSGFHRVAQVQRILALGGKVQGERDLPRPMLAWKEVLYGSDAISIPMFLYSFLHGDAFFDTRCAYVLPGRALSADRIDYSSLGGNLTVEALQANDPVPTEAALSSLALYPGFLSIDMTHWPPERIRQVSPSSVSSHDITVEQAKALLIHSPRIPSHIHFERLNAQHADAIRCFAGSGAAYASFSKCEWTPELGAAVASSFTLYQVRVDEPIEAESIDSWIDNPPWQILWEMKNLGMKQSQSLANLTSNNIYLMTPMNDQTSQGLRGARCNTLSIREIFVGEEGASALANLSVSNLSIDMSNLTSQQIAAIHSNPWLSAFRCTSSAVTQQEAESLSNATNSNGIPQMEISSARP